MKRRTSWVVFVVCSVLLFATVLSVHQTHVDIEEAVNPSRDVNSSEPSAQKAADATKAGARTVSSASGIPAEILMTEEQIAAVREADRIDREEVLKRRNGLEQKLDRFSRHPKALHIYSQGKNLTTLPVVFAVPSSSPFQGDEHFAPWESMSGFRFFEALDGTAWPIDAMPVVRVEGTNQLAVLTGSYTVKMNSLSALNDLTSRFNLTQVQTFESMQISYLQSPRRAVPELVAILNDLRNDSRVEFADLEMVDKLYVAR